MWSRLKQFLGIIPDFTDSEEVFRALHGDVAVSYTHLTLPTTPYV